MGERSFGPADQEAFAALSGDRNPMHVDAEAARRLAFDRPVVHGIHGVLWALETWLAGRGGGGPLRLERLAAEFRTAIRVGDAVACRVLEDGDGTARIVLEGAGRAEIRLAAAPAAGSGPAPPRPDGPAACRDRVEAGLAAAAGAVPVALEPGRLAAMYPRVAGRLPAWQTAAVLAASRLVGMECPGLHSVFLGFGLDFAADPPAAVPALRYRVARYDPRFRFLAMEVAAPGLGGEVRALVRARPVTQPALAALAPLVPAGAFVGRRALVVGGSRGLGETCAKLMAAGGAELVLTYARGAADAGRVVAEIVARGGAARCRALDVTAVPPGWRDALDGWRPTDLLYFATPRIARRRGGPDDGLLGQFRAYYVDGFLETFYEVFHQGLERVLYPSSVYAAERPAGFEEYAMAKLAGEALCAELAGRHPTVAFRAPRLPRLATDQTEADAPPAAPVLLARLLEPTAGRDVGA